MAAPAPMHPTGRPGRTPGIQRQSSSATADVGDTHARSTFARPLHPDRAPGIQCRGDPRAHACSTFTRPSPAQRPLS